MDAAWGPLHNLALGCQVAECTSPVRLQVAMKKNESRLKQEASWLHLSFVAQAAQHNARQPCLCIAAHMVSRSIPTSCAGLELSAGSAHPPFSTGH